MGEAERLVSIVNVSTLETRAVLAAAYPGGRRSSPKTLLTHTVEVDAQERDVRVLCRRVKLDSLADAGAMDTGRRPSCPVCAMRDPRFRGSP